MAVVVVADVGRAGAVFVIDQQALAFARETSGTSGAFHPAFKAIVGLQQLPHSFIGSLGIFWRECIAAGGGELLYVVSAPGDRHFNGDLRHIHFGEPGFPVGAQIAVVDDVEQLADAGRVPAIPHGRAEGDDIERDAVEQGAVGQQRLDAVNCLSVWTLRLSGQQEFEERFSTGDRRGTEQIGGEREHESRLAMGLDQDTIAGSQMLLDRQGFVRRSNNRQAAKARPT